MENEKILKRYICFFKIMLLGMVIGCNSPSLEWHQQEDYRWAELPNGYFKSTGFESIPSTKSKINFSNDISEIELSENRHYLNGSGVAAGDIDGDGLVDLYFAGLGSSNKLYKNSGGMEFEDITQQAGVALDGYYSTGAVFADINGNGHLDLLVTSLHKKNVLFINNGKGRFTREEKSGLGLSKGSMTMTLADVDNDRDLDLYIANYKEKTIKDLYTTEELAWNNILKEPYDRQHQTGPFTLVPPFDKHYQIFMTQDNKFAGAAEIGRKDELYINQDGTFKKVNDTEKIFLNEQGDPLGLQPDWGLTAKFQDLNNDGLTDLYVCNDFFTPDRLWINQGNGIFKKSKWSAIRNMSFASMGVDFSDINRDGKIDIFTAEMLSSDHQLRLQQVGADDPLPARARNIRGRPLYNRNSLYLKRDDDTYAEIAYLSGIEGSGWSWDATFMDVNLDGYEDLLISTGYLYHVLDIDAQLQMVGKGRNMDEHFAEFIRNAPSLNLTNKIFINNGDLTFSSKGKELGFDNSDVSHGMAIADLDNNGTMDLVVNRMNQEAGIYQNKTLAPRIAVRLKGQAPNTQAIGAKIKLKGGPVVQQKEISAGGDYLSGSEPMVVFAADPNNTDHELTVTWPDGKESQIDSIQANRIYEVFEYDVKKKNLEIKKLNPKKRTLFQDVSKRIGHKHHEASFGDFDLQALLPIKMSRLGPGLSWIDIDRDGDDDLFIASGKGGSMGAFENTGGGTFEPLKTSPFSKTAPGDQSSVIGWNTEQGTNLIIGSLNYEQGTPQAPSAYRYRFDDLQIAESDSFSSYSTTGVLAASDYDDDSDIDLFIGGRFLPFHYPKNASSKLFTNEHGKFVTDKTNSIKLSEIGLVTGAVFSDYDQDKDQDLILSREWDSIVLLENNNGTFQDISAEVNLSQFKGWWNGIATGDFNNDGLPDIVVTNLGLNSPYQLVNDKPIRMYYDDLNRDGWVDIIEAQPDQKGGYVPRRRLYNYKSVPQIRNNMRSYEQFANSTLSDIFGSQLTRIPFKEINTLQHTIFLNTGSGFEPHPLPIEAQFSAAFHAGVADVDNDGNEDLFLSQNFFGVPSQEPRQDAGRGLLLRGDGNGRMKVISGNTSGIIMYGEQRGAAFSDFNKDGKIDLAASQNGAETKLFINQTTKTGYRITLKGRPSNQNGIGSSLRMVYENGKKGPVREIQSGSGYWSQSSFTQVMGASFEVEKIEITWGNGTRQRVKIKPGKKNYIISYPKMK